MTTLPNRRVRLEEILEPFVDDSFASSYRGLALQTSIMQDNGGSNASHMAFAYPLDHSFFLSFQ
jgi:hypothetical protein